jgi:hypothetical protein
LQVAGEKVLRLVGVGYEIVVLVRPERKAARDWAKVACHICIEPDGVSAAGLENTGQIRCRAGQTILAVLGNRSRERYRRHNQGDRQDNDELHHAEPGHPAS